VEASGYDDGGYHFCVCVFLKYLDTFGMGQEDLDGVPSSELLLRDAIVWLPWLVVVFIP